MCYLIKKYFLKHPKKVNMTYREHMNFSLNLSSIFLKASYQAFVHAIFPELYITGSSDASKKVVDLLEHRSKL
tara:strand:+ start:153 stop:371 length:219 start_codon:yes stop_codon:yes gene_type:complete